MLSERSIPLAERAVGCILGGALGDAWGGPTEGKPGQVKFEIPTHPVLSDDTQLTLATCEAIIESGCVNPQTIASSMTRWFREGRIHGMGSSTLKALRDLSTGCHWATAGARGEYSAGSGAAMRIAPVAFLLNPTLEADRVLIRDVCRITHANDEAYCGALAVVAAIHSVLVDEQRTRRSFLAIAAEHLPDSRVRDRIREISQLHGSLDEMSTHFKTSGHVADVVPMALYCADRILHEPLENVLAEAIGLGGDTDTIGSIAGQIAGAVVGQAGIPLSLGDVVGRDKVISIATAFADFIDSAPRH